MLKNGYLPLVALVVGLAPAARAQVAPAPAEKQETPRQTARVVLTYLGGLTSGLRAQVELLRADLQAAQNTLDRVRVLHETGRAPIAEVEQARHRVEVATISLREAEAKLAKEERLAVLERPLDVRFTDATLSQAAKALTEAAGMSIVLAEGIPAEKRLSMDAKGVTLGLLLETLAQKTDLMIAPDPRGVLIQPWPTLEVDGQRTIRRSPTAPWSEEWTGYLFYGDRAAAAAPFASGGGVVFSRGGPDGFATQIAPALPEPLAGGPTVLPAPTAPVAPPAVNLYNANPFVLGGGPSGPLTIAPLGDRSVVVAEPGLGESGEAGYWLTVYRFDGDRLRKQSSVFHPSARKGVLQFAVPGFVAPGTPPAPRGLFRPNRPTKPALPAPPKGPTGAPSPLPATKPLPGAPSTKPAPQPGAPDAPPPSPAK